MKRDQLFPSKYLKAADLDGKPRVLEIREAPTETLTSPDGAEQQKSVLYFTRGQKCLPLNLTNWDAVAEIAGGDTDGWAGHRIELYPTETELRGKVVDCIRIRPPQQADLAVPPAKPKAPPPPAKPSLRDDMDDEIPW